MSYAVKEIFYTLQGEGACAGRPAVFCRFSGCNLWSGREQHRERAVCRFCDTDFVGMNGVNGARYASATELAQCIASLWPKRDAARSQPMVVFTGGEPLLQLDAPLTAEMRSLGFFVAVETNGTRPAPSGIDWLCVSPKAGSTLLLQKGDELKLVFPQPGAMPEQFEQLDFRVFSLQPMDGPCRAEHLQAALDYCLRHPRWRLSLQTHKLLGIP